MIDWVSAKVPVRHPAPLQGGRTVILDADGNITRSTTRSAVIEGSHSAKVMLRTVDSRTPSGHFETIEFVGNPLKFLQGHNLWGPDELVPMFTHAFFRALNIIGVHYCHDEVAACLAGNFRISRVDVANNWTLPCRSDVLAWIRAASELSSLKYRGRGNLFGNSSLYFGQGSSRWSFKFYAKGDELVKNKEAVRESLPRRDLLLEYAASILRGELTMRGEELKRYGLNYGTGWTPASASNLFQAVIGRLSVGTNMALTSSTIADMPASARACYLLWEQGLDPRGIYSRSAFFRHRKALMPFGIDIAATKAVHTSNVVPLVRTLQAEPARIPQWAYEQGLVYQPWQQAA